MLSINNLDRCRYQHQYENLVYICKKCHSNGNEVEVTKRIQTQNDNSWYGLVKYAWSGDVIECPHCGEIYRSRQYWYGNKNPEEFAVRTEITHVWNMVRWAKLSVRSNRCFLTCKRFLFRQIIL